MASWCPFATPRYGPPSKLGGYYGLGISAPKIGEIKHSAVGYMGGIFSRLDGNNDASWHFTIPYDGNILQHYPIEAICWHGGSARWNIDTVGVEHEGGPPGNESEPLRPAQLASTVRLTAWLAEQFDRTGRYARYPNPAQWWLLEHRDIYATACPSGRIPWPQILLALTAPVDDQPSVERTLQALQAAIATAWVYQDPKRIPPHDRDVIRKVYG